MTKQICASCDWSAVTPNYPLGSTSADFLKCNVPLPPWVEVRQFSERNVRKGDTCIFWKGKQP